MIEELKLRSSVRWMYAELPLPNNPPQTGGDLAESISKVAFSHKENILVSK